MIERIPDLVNADANLVRRGRYLSTTFMLGIGEQGYLVKIIEGRVDLDNDLSLNDEGNGYLVRKGLIGGNRCFQQIEVELNFDSARQLMEKTITGGEFFEE